MGGYYEAIDLFRQGTHVRVAADAFYLRSVGVDGKHFVTGVSQFPIDRIPNMTSIA
jgi:hypothetical protein